EAADRVTGDEAQEPEDQQDDEDGPKHGVSPPSFRFGPRLCGPASIERMSCQAEVQSLVFQAQSRIFRRFRTENGCLARTTLARGRAEHSAGEPAERLRGGSRRAGRGDRFYGRKSRASIRQGEVRRDRGLAGESSRIPSFAGSSRPAARAVRTTLGRDRDEKGPRSGDS